MRLTRFEAQGFRNLDAVVLEPHPHLTVIGGENGAGKSSLLESIQCLATGHTFRTRQSRDYLAHGGTPLMLAARLLDPRDGSEHRCGMQRDDEGKVELRIDYRAATGVAEMARAMPVKALVPDSHRLLQEGPDERRRFIDWGCFHQFDDFPAIWRRFRRALSQRNEVLRQRGSDEELRSWDDALATDGTALDLLRRRYVEKLTHYVKNRAQLIDFPFHMELELRSGWPDDLSLERALHTRVEQHRRLKTTADGPHRAELAVRADGRLARPVMSRGQQKVLVYLLHLAQLDCLRDSNGIKAIVLCDDLAAELDADNTARVMDQLVSTGCQLFITAADPVPAAVRDHAAAADATWVRLDRGSLGA